MASKSTQNARRRNAQMAAQTPTDASEQNASEVPASVAANYDVAAIEAAVADVASSEPVSEPTPDASSEQSSETPASEQQNDTPAPITPVILSDEQREAVATIDKRLAEVSANFALLRNMRDDLRALRVSITGEAPAPSRKSSDKSSDAAATPKAPRVVKTEEEKQNDRRLYRFARRFARKHSIEIAVAQQMVKDGIIAPRVQDDADVTLSAEAKARLAAVKGAQSSSETAQRSATPAAAVIPGPVQIAESESHPDAQALADAIDAKLAGAASE